LVVRFVGRETRLRKAVQVLHGFPSLSRITPGGCFLLSPLPLRLSRGGSVDSACRGRISDMMVVEGQVFDGIHQRNFGAE